MASFKLWIGASAADTITRLAVQLASTMVVARILTAEEFGLASLVLGVTTIMAAFIGLPLKNRWPNAASCIPAIWKPRCSCRRC